MRLNIIISGILLLIATGCGLLEGPIITKVSPERAKVGDLITITGRNFGQSGEVKFGSVFVSHLDVESWTDNKIKVKIPVNLPVGSYIASVRTASRGSNTRKIFVKPSDWLFYDTVVTNYLDGTITTIDFSTMEGDTPIDVATIFNGASPYRAIFDDEKRAYFALRTPEGERTSGVATIDYSGESNFIYGMFVDGDITSVAYDGSNRAILSDYFSQKLLLFDPFSASVKDTVSLAVASSAYNEDVVFHSGKNQAWVINHQWQNDFIDVLTLTVTNADPPITEAFDIAFADSVTAPDNFATSGRMICHENSGTLYLTGQVESATGEFEGVLFGINTNDCDLTEAICVVSRIYYVGSEPSGMAFYPKSRFVIVANTGSDSISIVDTETGAVTDIEVEGSEPVAVTTSKLGEMILTANFASDDVSVFELPVGLGDTMQTTPDEADLSEIRQTTSIAVGDGPTDVKTAIMDEDLYPADATEAGEE